MGIFGWLVLCCPTGPPIIDASNFFLPGANHSSEFAPPGMEASLYEFLLTATNISITVGDICTTMMQGWLGLTKLNGDAFRMAFAEDLTQYHQYQTSMTIGLLATAVVSVV